MQRKLDHERRNPKSEDDRQANLEAQRKINQERQNKESEAKTTKARGANKDRLGTSKCRECRRWTGKATNETKIEEQRRNAQSKEVRKARLEKQRKIDRERRNN